MKGSPGQGLLAEHLDEEETTTTCPWPRGVLESGREDAGESTRLGLVVHIAC